MTEDTKINEARRTILTEALKDEGKVYVIHDKRGRIVHINDQNYDSDFTNRKLYLWALDELLNDQLLEPVQDNYGRETYELTYAGIKETE